MRRRSYGDDEPTNGRDACRRDDQRWVSAGLAVRTRALKKLGEHLDMDLGVDTLGTYSLVNGALHCFNVGGNFYGVDLVTGEVEWRG